MDYSAEVRRRFDSLRGAGQLGAKGPGCVSAETEDRSLNVWLRFEVQVLEGIIQSARFQVYGCPHAVAAASRAAEWLEGRAASSLGSLDVHGLAADLEVPVNKLGKLLLIEDALAGCARALAEGGHTSEGR
jgi:NifU-like protein involved in Fe-S cluster formation